MATKAVFYILNTQSNKERAIYTCRIIEKAYSHNRKIYVHANNLEEAQSFDIQLWTFSDISFIPHEIYHENSAQDAAIVIGYDPTPVGFNDVLVNLTSEVVPFYQQFKHLIEVLPNDDNLKSHARNRFKVYQQQGYQVEVFKV